MKTSETSGDIYQLKITLVGSSNPPIWRRILAPASMSLAQLHDAIQLVFGWQECHLHEFTAGHERYGPPDPDDDFGGLPPPTSERKTKLPAVLGWVKARLNYTYDFGDGWEHAIVTEKILAPDAALAYPICTAGKGHCPPEDCGGLGGYYDLLKVLSNPKDPEYAGMLEWVGGPIDKHDFSVADADERLGSMRKKR